MEESESVLSWFLTNGLSIVIIIAAGVVTQRFARMFITRTIRRAIQSDNFASEEAEKKREDTIISIVSAVTRVLIAVIVALLVIAQFGVDIGPLIAGLSVVGVAVGFGAQSLVKDFVAGLFIIMENQYRVGDVVEIAGVSGTVLGISMRETSLRDLDGNVHHVPNGLIEVATNMTMEFANVNLNVGVSYDSDIKQVEEVVNTVGEDMASDSEWKDAILEAPAFVRVDNFGPSEVVIKIVGKVQPGEQWAVAGAYRERIKAAFEDNNIEIPLPQTVIHQAKDK